VIVAVGMAIAVALVIVVDALSAGVRDAQREALASVYGVGTDLTVTGAQAEPGEGSGMPQFDFGEDAGSTDEDGTTTLSQSRLMPDIARGTLEASTVDAAAGIDGVVAAVGALSLTNMTFDGELPSPPSGADESARPEPAEGDAGGPAAGGFGGGSFGIDSFSVLGIDAAAATQSAGPLSSTAVEQGRGLGSADAGQRVAALDASYASSEGLSVGDTIEVGSEEFSVIGVLSSTSSTADTAADVYIPLDVAQELSGLGEAVSTVYVQAAAADAIGDVRSALEEALPDAAVRSQSELASTVSSSLSGASALITTLGTWLSVIVLVVAVALAVLFTMSGISRRTRELGTLKAIGWSNRRIVGQVTSESVVQAVIGGVGGVAIGLVGAAVVALIAPTISAESPAQPVGGMRAGRGSRARTRSVRSCFRRTPPS